MQDEYTAASRGTTRVLLDNFVAGDNRLPVLAAEIEALDGELMPPPKQVARERLSGPDEDKLGELIKAEHEAGERSLKDAVKHFMKCGDFLLQAKAGLPHGRFAFFLEHTAKLHPRMAQRYMMLARELPKLPKADATRVSQLSLRDAIGELSRTSSRAAKLPTPRWPPPSRKPLGEPLKQTVIKARERKELKYLSLDAQPATSDREAAPACTPSAARTVADAGPLCREACHCVLSSGPFRACTSKALPVTNGRRGEACYGLNEVYCHLSKGYEAGVDALRSGVMSAPAAPALSATLNQHDLRRAVNRDRPLSACDRACVGEIIDWHHADYGNAWICYDILVDKTGFSRWQGDPLCRAPSRERLHRAIRQGRPWRRQGRGAPGTKGAAGTGISSTCRSVAKSKRQTT